jgi:hypothetical protein
MDGGSVGAIAAKALGSFSSTFACAIEIVSLTVRCVAKETQCPNCDSWSDAFHGSYER